MRMNGIIGRTNMQNPHRALEAIERLVGSDFGMDMEWLLVDVKNKKEKIDPRLKQAAEIIGQIYMISHAEGKCLHKDWEQIKYDILKQPEE